jgi:hypothetical protein
LGEGAGFFVKFAFSSPKYPVFGYLGEAGWGLAANVKKSTCGVILLQALRDEN